MEKNIVPGVRSLYVEKGNERSYVNGFIEILPNTEDFDFDGSDGATSNTVFSGNDNNGNALGYSAGKVLVYKNGLLLRSGTDYTATNGTSVTLGSSASNSDVIRISAFTGSYENVGSGSSTSGNDQFLLAGGVLHNRNTGGIILNGDNSITTSPDVAGTIQLAGDTHAVGDISIKSLSSTRNELRLFDNDNSHYVALKSPATVSSNVSFTMPSADGTANFGLITNGSGAVSFIAIPLTTTTFTAGDGLIGGGTLAADRVFSVGEGAFITVTADAVAVDATSTNTSGKVVVRDGSGNFAGAVITGTSLTDGTATLTNGGLSLGGAITGATGITSSGTIQFGSLSDGTITATAFVDEDNMASNSASLIPTQQSVKAYVDTSNTNVVSFVQTGFNSDSNNTRDLGASGNKWANVYATTFQGVATTAQYADMAEVYSSDADYEAGTVVKLGGDAEITMTTTHADTDVFGVISTSPAYLMNAEAEGLPVAMTGRVPVKVIGKISKGERLVSSDVPGLAWALGDDQYDTRAVIGRSLEDKNDGNEGIVEAVVGVK